MGYRTKVTFALLAAILAALFATSCSAPRDESASTGPTATAESTQGNKSADTQAGPSDTAAASQQAAGDQDDVVDVSPPQDWGSPPAVPTGPLERQVAQAVETAFGTGLGNGVFDDAFYAGLDTLGASADPRVAWWLTDLLRVARSQDMRAELVGGLSELLQIPIDPLDAWGQSVDHLIAWDVPAPPDYLEYKRNVYLAVEPRWEPLFDADAEIDWRYLSWGGVLIDDRPYGRTGEQCSCIPAADNPAVTDVAGGDAWLDDDAVVFGVVIEGEARAYPRSTMEVREMVNDTLGGRDIAMPYCTLCGSAQVYLTDDVPAGVARPVLRTSGLLSRSNKVMYDVETWSVFDTFTGRALSGPLLETGVVLNQHSVLASTWGEWKAAYPATTVLAIGEALGRPDSDLRNTRDGDGPIFPIGDVDPRLGVQTDVIGVISADGAPVAFEVAAAHRALAAGQAVVADGVEVVADGGGLRAVDARTGDRLGSHQAFWFAWSQFHPDTALWGS